MITAIADGPDLYGDTRDGDLSTDNFAAVCKRLFNGDPQWALNAVLKIDRDTAAALLAGSMPVSAPLALALLRCCHGLPILKRIIASLKVGDKDAERRAKADYAAIMNAPNKLSSDDGRFQQCCEWSAQLTEFLLLRLDLVPDHDQ